MLILFYKWQHLYISANIHNPIQKTINNYTMGTTYSCLIIISQVNNFYSYSFLLNMNIQRELHSINKLMSTYDSSSTISIINNIVKNTYFLSSYNMHFVIYHSINSSFINDRAFQMNIDNIVNIWGFGSYAQIVKTPCVILIYKFLFSNKYIVLLLINKNIILKYFKNTLCNISSTAKGYSVDQIYKINRLIGIANILCEIGGETRTAGINYCKKIWILGLLEPYSHNLLGFIKLIYITLH